MIDSLTIFVAGGKIEVRGELKDFRCWQEDVNTRKGSYRNILFRETPRGLWIDGSLHKFLKGDNLGEFTRDECFTALKRLEEDLGVDLSRGEIKKIEFGKNFSMKHSVSSYLETLGNYRNYRDVEFESMMGGIQRNSTWKNGLTGKRWDTKTGYLSFCVYDKLEEMGKKAPKELEGQNIVRLEYRIKNQRGVQAVFNRVLHSYDITSSEVWDTLNDRFIKFYSSIQKLKFDLIEFKGRSRREIDEYFLAKGYILHTREVFEKIEMARKNGMSRQEAYQYRCKVRRLIAKYSVISDITSELDSKIMAA